MREKTVLAVFAFLLTMVCITIISVSFNFNQLHICQNQRQKFQPDYFQSTLAEGMKYRNSWHCNVEEHFLIPLYISETRTEERPRITLVSEFFVAHNYSIAAVHANLRDNVYHARFIYLLGDSPKQIQSLRSLLPEKSNIEVYYAPGGVTYRHLFAAAMLYPEAFLIHNADIAVGNLTTLLDACIAEKSFDDAVLVGSRVDALREGARCEEYSLQGSFDAYLTNRENMDCSFLDNLRFPPYYWGAENVVASQIPKSAIANLCPYWKFAHHHPGKAVASQKESEKSGLRKKRIRVSHANNAWYSVDMHAGPYPPGSIRNIRGNKNEKVLASLCNLSMLNGSLSRS